MNAPILIFGMPRSGTTWIGKLFDSHPDTLYRHEPDSVHPLSMPLFPDKAAAPTYQRELVTFVSALPAMRSAKVVGKRPIFPKHYLSVVGLEAYRACVIAAKVAGRIGGDLPCLYRPTGRRFADSRIVWKSIESPGRLGACIEALPEARAVYILRHPCGYVSSTLAGEAARRFGDATPSADAHWLLGKVLGASGGASRGLRLDDFKKFTPEERLAWRWVLIQEKILGDVAECDRVLTVRYEDVCTSPAETTRRMFEFVGLDWNLQTEAFVQRSSHGEGQAYYGVVKSPATAERWRSRLAPGVQRRILDVLRRSELNQFYPEDGEKPSLAAAEGAAA